MSRQQRNINLDFLREIQELNFAVIETVLYLNTHPEDRKVLELHNEFATQYKNLVEEYQKNYRQLYAFYPTDYPWQWIDEPWPWQIEY